MREGYDEELIQKLNNMLNIPNLGQWMRDDANKYIKLLGSKNINENDKHFIRVLAEDLLSKSRVFLEVEIPKNNRR